VKYVKYVFIVPNILPSLVLLLVGYAAECVADVCDGLVDGFSAFAEALHERWN